MEPAIHIHEDDWGLRNLHPLAARAQAAADLGESIAARERNRAPSGLGWTAAHVIETPSVSYLDAGLRLEDAAAALALLMPRVRMLTAAGSGALASTQCGPGGPNETESWCFGL